MTTGHNNPPSAIETVNDTARSLSDWLSEHVAIDEATATEAKTWIDRGKLCLQDMEAERDAKVRPLNEKVETINSEYREPRNLLKAMLNELTTRINNYLYTEEAKREALALAARQAAEAAERLAREAERVEQERLDDARRGELGVDLASATIEADTAFRAYEKAERQATIAERDAKVRIGGGFSRAIGLKTKETLVVQDAVAALTAMGLTDDIAQAICKGARAYRKIYNRLPDGVVSTTDRSI